MISPHNALFSVSVGYMLQAWSCILVLPYCILDIHFAPLLPLQVSTDNPEAPGVLIAQQSDAGARMMERNRRCDLFIGFGVLERVLVFM